MAIATPTERIDLIVDPATKRLAERAAAVAGYVTLTDFLTHLIRENATAILNQPDSIKVTNEEFDNFMVACQDTAATPSPRILETAKRLDQEGF